MFTSLKQRILLGIYIFILVSIPVGAYLASQATQIKSQATENKLTKTITKPPTPTASPNSLDQWGNLDNPSRQTPTPSSDTTAYSTSFGPTLSLKILIDGRPTDNQATKLFVGIISGTNLQSPQYLLSFTVDVPASGQFDNISLAGLTVGSNYTAILKGDTQIATSSAFVMNPAVTNLNSGLSLAMLSGDLNQDNVINDLDQKIVQAALGQKNVPSDLNKDSVVNGIDLAILNKNLNQVGASGVWASTPKTTASENSPSVGSPEGSSSGLPAGGQGYWVWVPK